MNILAKLKLNINIFFGLVWFRLRLFFVWFHRWRLKMETFEFDVLLHIVLKLLNWGTFYLTIYRSSTKFLGYPVCYYRHNFLFSLSEYCGWNCPFNCLVILSRDLYSGSLGHKVNHSFSPNCRYTKGFICENRGDNFVIDYLDAIETEFENTSACLSGDQMCSNNENNWRSKISWHTPLLSKFQFF